MGSGHSYTHATTRSAAAQGASDGASDAPGSRSSHRIRASSSAEVTRRYAFASATETGTVLGGSSLAVATDARDRDLYLRTKRHLASRTWAYVQDYADAKTEAVSIAFTQSDSESDNVSAAVAFNVVLLDAEASLGNGTTVAGSVTVEAGTTAGQMNEFKAMAVSGAGSKQSSTGGDTTGGTDAEGTGGIGSGTGGGTGGSTGGGTGGDSSSLGIAGAVAFTIYGSPATNDPNTVSATIADGATVTASSGDVTVTARQDVGMQNVAGGAARPTERPEAGS